MLESPRGLSVREAIRVKSVRKAMAQTMKASVDTAALSQVTREIDLTDLRHSGNSDTSAASLNTLIMAATARTLRQHPMLNAELVERDILIYNEINLGMAVATDAGLIVAVVHKADTLSVAELFAAITTLAERARNGELTMADVEGGTFTASNLGMYGIDSGFPIPRAPEGAIMLVGAARARPAVHNNELAIRQIATFSLTFDHRFIDGATAAAFLQDLNTLLTAPDALCDGA